MKAERYPCYPHPEVLGAERRASKGEATAHPKSGMPDFGKF